MGRASFVIWAWLCLWGSVGVGLPRVGNLFDDTSNLVDGVLSVLGHWNQVLGKDSPEVVMWKISPVLVSHVVI